MTSKQAFKLYFPAWGACARANNWRMKGGRLVGPVPSPGATLSGQLLSRVWIAAEQRSRRHHRYITPEDLRHACHVVALGSDKSSADLNNKELDRVVALFNLLSDPDNLNAVIAWDNPEAAERKRLVWSISQNNPAYVASLAEDKFATHNWRDLPIRDLKQLNITLKNRPRAQAPAHVVPALAGACDNQPF